MERKKLSSLCGVKLELVAVEDDVAVFSRNGSDLRQARRVTVRLDDLFDDEGNRFENDL